MFLTANPGFNQRIKLLPTTKVEIADAEVSPMSGLNRLFERRKEMNGYIVKYVWHLEIPGDSTRSAFLGGLFIQSVFGFGDSLLV